MKMDKNQVKYPLFRKIDCIRIPVPSLEDGLEFYCNSLGHEIIWRTSTSIGLSIPESEAEIVIHTEPDKMETDITVESAEIAAQEFIQSGGSIVQGPFDIPIGKCVVVTDPWKNQLVLLDNSKGLYQTNKDGKVIGLKKKEL